MKLHLKKKKISPVPLPILQPDWKTIDVEASFHCWNWPNQKHDLKMVMSLMMMIPLKNFVMKAF